MLTRSRTSRSCWQASAPSRKTPPEKKRENALLAKPNVPVIALEEHYADPELYAQFTGLDAATPPHVVEKLKDTGAARLKDMDAAGIDVQVLSHSAPSLQKIASGAVELARRVNDRLAGIVRTARTRYAAFAALPTRAPARIRRARAPR